MILILGDNMGYWNSRGLRGNALEELINITNDVYRNKGLAMIQKIPTPIKPIAINKENRTITLAYFEQKSTVDYIGVIQGIPVCFDAKETANKSLPIQNIHEHQVKFMEDFVSQKGVAFLLVYFSVYEEYFLLPFETFKDFWEASIGGGRKSIPYSAFEKKYLISSKNGNVIHYLDALNIYLQQK